MGLTVIVVLGALALGRLRGGSLSRLSSTPLRGRRLVAVALIAEVVGGLAAIANLSGSATAYRVGLVIAAAAGLAFCWRNAAVGGLALIGFGLLLNAIVVGVNGAMPVSFVQAARAGANVTAIAAAEDPRHVLAGPGSRLRWLGDVIPVPLPVRSEVDSPGDVLIAAGLAEFVVAGMGASATRRSPRHRSGSANPKLSASGRAIAP